MQYSYNNHLSQEQESLVWHNRELTAKELAELVGAKVWHVRYYLYSLGYKKMKVEYWTPEQVGFLQENYRQIGDKEIAQIFEQRWPKDKTWTLKHIEKKRNYLGLCRTKKELKQIKERNRLNGNWRTGKTWEKRGESGIGDTREWPDQQGVLRKFIKTASGFVPMARVVWNQHNKPLPKGWKIRFKDGNPLNCTIQNMEPVSQQEHGRRNAEIASQRLSDNYVVSISTMKAEHLREDFKKMPELIQLMRNRLILKREINKQRLN
jgi:hypothetical protein